MKAILINVNDKTISNVETTEPTLQSWYKLIGCDLVAVGVNLDDHDSIMVDDEGLLTLTEKSNFFTFEGAHQPFAGNGLIVGVDEEGETIPPNITVAEVFRKVEFYTIQEIRAKFGNDAAEPHMEFFPLP